MKFLLRAQKASNTILKHVSHQGNNYISVAKKLYKVKMLGLLLYSAQLCVYKDASTLKATQAVSESQTSCHSSIIYHPLCLALINLIGRKFSCFSDEEITISLLQDLTFDFWPNQCLEDMFCDFQT